MRGRYFEEWLGERFAESSLGTADPTFSHVERTDLPPDLPPDQRERARFRLRVIASDITAGRMLVLPDDITVTLDRYGHLMPGSEREAAGMLDAFLARAPGPR